MARRNSSGFSVRLHLRAFASASTRVKDSTSPTIGLKRSPRPCAFAESAPPMLSRSAPVCFCGPPRVRSSPAWLGAGGWRRWAQRSPACTARMPFSLSKPRTLSIRPMSTRMVSVPNCWAPIACRPPAMLIARFSARAWRTIAWMASREPGVSTRWTRVSLSRECTSLTTTPGAACSCAGAPASERAARATRRATPFPDTLPIGLSPLGRRRHGNEVAARHEDEQEGRHLDHVKERVVVEVGRVNGDAQPLDDRPRDHEQEADQAGEKRALPVAPIRDQKGERDEEDGGSVVRDGDPEALVDGQDDEGVRGAFHGRHHLDEPGGALGEKKPAPDGPAREGRQADRQEHDPPEDGAPGRLPQEEAVDGAAGQGSDARGGEQEGEEVAQPPAGGLAAEEQTGENRALERHAVIREGDVGLGQARRS